MKKKATALVHRHCDPYKAADYYLWGFGIAVFAWATRWVVVLVIAAHVIEPGDGVVDIFEKAWAIVSDRDSVLPAIAFGVFHTLFGALKWLGLAYGVLGLAQRRKAANT